MKKIAAILSTVLLAASAVSVASPAVAKDTSWGCGGACRTVQH